jgi:Xaa-Pro aminopeptidase
MQERMRSLLKPGITTRDLVRKRPKPGENLKTSAQIRKWRGTWANHLGGMGIAWDTPPYFYTLDDPEFVIEKNMTVAYHGIFHVSGEAGGMAIENTYAITDTGCESLTKWPYEEIMIIGL